jgi:hypothetical protein
MFSGAQVEKLVPEAPAKKNRASPPAKAAGLNDAAPPPGPQNEARRAPVQEGLIAGEEHIISGGAPGGLKPQAYAFPLPLFGRFVPYHPRPGKALGQGGCFFAGYDKENPSLTRSGKPGDQLQGMPGQGPAPEGFKQFVSLSKAAGKARCHEYGGDGIHDSL